MSASREKKQRQGTGPDQKALQAQQEQAARKRKTIIYTAVGVVIAVLVAALLIWNSGFFQSRATAATLGGESLTTAELSYYYHNARTSYINTASMWGISFDTSVPDDEQMASEEEGTTLRDSFLETALSDAQLHLALYHEALDAGYTEADIKEDLDAAIESFKSQGSSYGYDYAAYLRASYGPYMNAATYEKLTARYLLARLISSDKGEELYNSYSQDDLRAYYDEDENADTLDTFEYSYLYFTPAEVETKDADGNDLDEDTVNERKSEALADAKAAADEALAEYEDGEEIAHLIEHYEPNTSGDHISIVGSSRIAAAYRDELLSLKDDEATIVENGQNGYYLVVYHGRTLVEDPTTDVRHILVRAEAAVDEHEDHTHEEAPTEADWAAAKTRMDEIQAAWESSDKTEEAFAALANEHSDDGDGTTGGLYERTYDGSFVPEFNEWVFDQTHSHGDVGLVQHVAQESDQYKYYGYHLIYYVGDNEPVWMGSARTALANQDQTAWQDELAKDYESALASGASYLGT